MSRFVFSFWSGLILLVSLNHSVYGQVVQLQASVNKTTVGLNETFEYSLKVTGQSTSLPTPSLPDLADFTIIAGPNSSTSIQLINGRMETSRTLSYYLQPQKTGTFKIPAVTIEVNGEEIRSNELTITVEKTAPGSASAPANQPKSSQDNDISGQDLYFKAVVDKKNVFQNEQILLTYKLYFRIDVRSYNFEKIPANPGFWNEEFKLPAQPVVETEIVNGVAYKVATLRQVALFPTRVGELQVEPLTVIVDALVRRQRRSRSLFDDFFNDPFGRTVRKAISSDPIKIKVKPLPEQNKPAKFNGAVGNYKLSVKSDKDEFKANEAISVKINITGNGNVKLLSMPDLKVPQDMEIYDPKENTEIIRENGLVRGTKEVEYIIVPRFAGDYTIPPVEFYYFDPVAQRYRQLSSDPIRLSIAPGTAIAGGNLAGAGLSKQEVELLGEDIRFIKEAAHFYESGVRIYSRWYYGLLYIFPLIGLVFVWNFNRQREKLRGDVYLARRKRAGKIAARHLREARKALIGKDQRDFYRITSQALQGFVSDKLNIQMTDFSETTVTTALTGAGAGDDEIQEYINCLQESDFRQFAGGEAKPEEMQAFFRRVRKVLTQLEKYI